jgi:hypothetical protein
VPWHSSGDQVLWRLRRSPSQGSPLPRRALSPHPYRTVCESTLTGRHRGWTSAITALLLVAFPLMPCEAQEDEGDRLRLPVGLPTTDIDLDGILVEPAWFLADSIPALTMTETRPDDPPPDTVQSGLRRGVRDLPDGVVGFRPAVRGKRHHGGMASATGPDQQVGSPKMKRRSPPGVGTSPEWDAGPYRHLNPLSR